MSTIDEILATMPEDSIEDIIDEAIVIDPNTRQLNVPGSELVFGVESDAHADRKYFIVPRIVGNNIDLASCFIRVNYRNGNGEMDAYLVDDVTVIDDKILFSWKLSSKVTKYYGQVAFVICACRPGAKGSDAVEWHTTQATGLVLEGIEPDIDGIASEANDAVATLIAMVENQTTIVENEGATQVKVVQTAAKTAETASVAEIDAKGVNTLASIPDDYTALSEAVGVIERGMAPGIICEAEGSSIAISDASDNYVKNLRIFGKSTQDGTPTPDAPVEIESVESPVVTVCGKNLLSRNYATEYHTYNGIAYTDAGDGKVAVNGTATANATFAFVSFAANKRTFIPAGTYTVSGNPSEDVYLGFYLYDSQEASDYSQATSRIKGGKPWTFTVEKDSYYGTYLNVPIGNTVSTVISPQLEIGSVATKYEAPTIPRTVKLTHTLPGIPVTSGGNYTDSDGQQWICDEVDLGRGVYVQRVETINITGTENWTEHSSGRFYAQTKSRDTYLNKFVLCSHVTHSASSMTGLYGSVGSRGVYFNRNAFYETLDDLIVFLKANTPVFIAVLATPIEIPLTEAEIASFRALHTNKPNTTILNDAGAHMAVEYVADTKLYIDNKITALISGV